MNTNDKEKAKEIALNSVFKSDYPYDEHSVRYGAEEMAKYKNEFIEKLKSLADGMYYKMKDLSTNLEPLRFAMQNYNDFIIKEFYKE